MLDHTIYENIETMNLSTDIRGWHSDHVFFKEMIDEVKPAVIAELGSWKGASAINMALLCNAKIYCIDTWLGGVDHMLSPNEVDAIPKKHGYPQMYFQFIHNIKSRGLHKRIIPVPNTTQNGLKYIHAKGVVPQLIYIDASHEEYDVALDVGLCRSLFPNAVLFGDDFNWDSVRAGLGRVSGVSVTPSRDGVFWMFKP